MSNDADLHVVAIDRLHDGFFIYFDNGDQGFFPDHLLYTLLDDPQVTYRTPLYDLEELQSPQTQSMN